MVSSLFAFPVLCLLHAGAHRIIGSPEGFDKKFTSLERKIHMLEQNQQLYYTNLVSTLKATDDLKQKVAELQSNLAVLNERDGVEEQCKKLSEKYLKIGTDVERQSFLDNLGDLERFSPCLSQKDCGRAEGLLRSARSNPCQGAGCQDSQAALACRSQKLQFLRWAQAVCAQMHKEELRGAVLGCVETGIRLLFAQDDAVPAKEWATAPINKQSLVLWTRVSPEQREKLLKPIPGGFILSQTMLGAVAQLPGVDDLRHCSWEAQKSLWASNSASLVAEMKAGKPVYFVSGIDLLGDRRRPFGKTVAFGLELPILGRAYNHVPELTVINIHRTTQLDHLCAAVRGALGVGADKLQIRKANCRHCISKQLPGNCMEACVLRTTVFQPKDYERVMGDAKSLASMLQNGLQMTSVQAQTLLPRAIEQGDTTLAQACVKMGAHVDNVDPTLLDRAIADGNVSTVKLLRKLGARTVRDLNQKLLDATRSGNYQSVAALLAAGASPNAMAPEGNHDTPLHNACLSGGGGGHKGPADRFPLFAIATQLLTEAHANVNAKNSAGNTPLHNAALYGNVEAARVLLSAHANVNERNRDQWPPLAFAAKAGDVEMVRLLLGAGADANAQAIDRKTPLFEAAWHGCTEAARVLLDWRADVNAKCVRFHGGLTPLGAAQHKRRAEVAQLLRSRGGHT